MCEYVEQVPFTIYQHLEKPFPAQWAIAGLTVDWNGLSTPLSDLHEGSFSHTQPYYTHRIQVKISYFQTKRFVIKDMVVSAWIFPTISL